MSTKYNLLPKASHFIGFSWGESTHIHYSYTPTHLYRKTTITIEDAKFEYVEFCEIDKDSLCALNEMPADDYTGPRSYFDKWGMSELAPESLDEALYGYRLSLQGCEELKSELEQEDPNSETYNETKESLSLQYEVLSDELRAIENIIYSLNKKSGFCNKSKTIRKIRISREKT